MRQTIVLDSKHKYVGHPCLYTFILRWTICEITNHFAYTHISTIYFNCKHSYTSFFSQFSIQDVYDRCGCHA